MDIASSEVSQKENFVMQLLINRFKAECNQPLETVDLYTVFNSPSKEVDID
jgi:hypothetical protein